MEHAAPVEPTVTVPKKLIDKIYEMAGDVRDNMILTIKSQERYKELMDLPLNEIPLSIHQYPDDSYQQFILRCRLEDKDPFEVDITKCIELLWDCEFSVEDYKEIGYNDGMIGVINILLDIVGDKETAQKTRLLTYNE